MENLDEPWQRLFCCLFFCCGWQPIKYPALFAGNQLQTSYTITHLGMLGAFSVAPTINNAALTALSMRAADEPAQINFVQGRIAFEFVGQATNFAPTPSAPLAPAKNNG